MLPNDLSILELLVSSGTTLTLTDLSWGSGGPCGSAEEPIFIMCLCDSPEAVRLALRAGRNLSQADIRTAWESIWWSAHRVQAARVVQACVDAGICYDCAEFGASVRDAVWDSQEDRGLLETAAALGSHKIVKTLLDTAGLPALHRKIMLLDSLRHPPSDRQVPLQGTSLKIIDYWRGWMAVSRPSWRNPIRRVKTRMRIFKCKSVGNLAPRGDIDACTSLGSWTGGVSRPPLKILMVRTFEMASRAVVKTSPNAGPVRDESSAGPHAAESGHSDIFAPVQAGAVYRDHNHR